MADNVVDMKKNIVWPLSVSKNIIKQFAVLSICFAIFNTHPLDSCVVNVNKSTILSKVFAAKLFIVTNSWYNYLSQKAKCEILASPKDRSLSFIKKIPDSLVNCIF